MIDILKSSDRAVSDHGDVAIWRSLAYGNPRDPRAGGYGPLLSIAETYIAPAAGFPMHPHRDMEIVSYMATGAMAHRDSLGNVAVIGHNEIQRMSAGTGVIHSEFNPSEEEACCCLQIWIAPTSAGIPPSYEQTAFNAKPGVTLIAAPQGKGGAVAIHADIALYAVRLESGAGSRHSLPPGRRAYLQLAHGAMTVNGKDLEIGDGAAIEAETDLDFKATAAGCEALLFEIP